MKPVKREELNAAITVAVKRFKDIVKLEDENSQLSKALVARKDIEKAKGKLIKSGLDEAEAYRWLQKHARNNRQTVHQSALTILKMKKAP